MAGDPGSGNSEPLALLEAGGRREAGAPLLRLLGPAWVGLDRLVEHLRDRLPDVLREPGADFVGREGRWIRDAAARLHRLGMLDAMRGSEGVTAVRARGSVSSRSGGFLLTPDREILIAPGELPASEYGRLCPLAPYVDGDVVYRHRLTREGLAADLEAGHDDAVAFLEARSRTGLPGAVRDTLHGWARSAARVTLLTGVRLLESDSGFRLLSGAAPPGARVLTHGDREAARLEVDAGVVRVPFGADPLSVRALAGRLGPPLAPAPDAWRWRLAPGPVADVEGLLEALTGVHQGLLPGELEAAVRAAGGAGPVRAVQATILELPPETVDALVRDRVLGPLVMRTGDESMVVVAQRDAAAVTARMEVLGFRVEAEVAAPRATMPPPEET